MVEIITLVLFGLLIRYALKHPKDTGKVTTLVDERFPENKSDKDNSE